MTTRKKISAASAAAVKDNEIHGGWLIEYEFGATLNRQKYDTYIVNALDVYEVENHLGGGTLLFLSEDDARDAFECDDLGLIMQALMYFGNLPEMKYYNSDEYEVI